MTKEEETGIDDKKC